MTVEKTKTDDRLPSEPPSRTYNLLLGFRVNWEGAVGLRSLVLGGIAVSILSTAFLLTALVVTEGWRNGEMRQMSRQVEMLRDRVKKLEESCTTGKEKDPESLQLQLVPALVDPGASAGDDEVSSALETPRFKRAPKDRHHNRPIKDPTVPGADSLADCPKARNKKNPAPAYIHLHGNDDREFNTVTGLLKVWKEQEWCRYPLSNKNNPSPKPFAYDATIGSVTVQEAGIYLVYGQITFISFHQTASFAIHASSSNGAENPRVVSKCHVRSKDVNFTQPVTCSVTTTVCLNSQDKVHLVQTDLESRVTVVMDMRRELSYFGLYRLVSVPPQRGKPQFFCPPTNGRA